MQVGARCTPTKEEMADTAEEFGRVLQEIRSVLHQWQRYQRTGILGDRATLVHEAGEVCGRARYAVRSWVNQGAWSGYYMVTSTGLVHNCLACRTITDYTPLRPLAALSGMTIDEVVGAGYSVCGHCRRRPHHRTVERVQRFVDRVCVTLDDIVVTLGTN